MPDSLDFVFLGLSITSSWGNGHATTYRSLLKALRGRGHEITFLERNRPWYASQRDLPDPPFADCRLYDSVEELQDRWGTRIAEADVVVLGSYVPDGAEIARWLTQHAQGLKLFYDIDTPVTLTKLAAGSHEYLAPESIPDFDLYLSFTGGPSLDLLRRFYRAPRVEALYCSVDPEVYFPGTPRQDIDLAYMGTYSGDRQPALQAMLLDAARAWPEGRFAVVGAQYPQSVHWPDNVIPIEHLPPSTHRRFYTGQRFALNLTRTEMLSAGYSSSVRLFEAAACGTPVITDSWRGLDTFFRVGEEILVAECRDDVLRYLQKLPEVARRRIGERARARVLAAHTSTHRAIQLERLIRSIRNKSPRCRTAVRQAL